jgi:hypothetical protein
MTTIASPIQAVTDLANLQPAEKALREFRQKHNLEYDLSDNLAGKYGDDPDRRVLYFRDLVQRLWSDVPDLGALDIVHELLLARANVRIDWRQQRIVYHPQTPLQAALYALLTNNHLAKRCANPSCVKPFFIAERVDERYCSTRCKWAGRLASKRDWIREARRKK